MYEKIARWYKWGLWTASMVNEAARNGVITKAQAEQIIML